MWWLKKKLGLNKSNIKKDVNDDIKNNVEPIEQTNDIKSDTIVVENDKPYIIPKVSLLHYSYNRQNTNTNIKNIEYNIERLESILKTFKIEGKVTAVKIGPRFTKYEVLLKEGTILKRLININKEIAMGMAEKIVEISPSCDQVNTVVISISNKHINFAMFEDVLHTAIELKNSLTPDNHHLLLALGKDMDGTDIVTNLCQLPNILISGSTGSGISMCLNSMISSLLMLYTPDEVKMVMIDTKKVQLSTFEGVPHLLYPVIVDDYYRVGIILDKIEQESVRRCKLFNSVNVKNIIEYKNMLKSGTFSIKDDIPYIVVFIDDLSDLIKTYSNGLVESIVKITQLARTSGIYMVLAIQRPTSDIITGAIKSNIPARISFSVPSTIDSRLILDNSGAEKLDVNGDMLFKTKNSELPIRIQGCYISDENINRIITYCKSQCKNNYENNFLSEEPLNENSSDVDPLYNEVVEFVVSTQKASASLLQRRFKLGYNRAAEIINSLEEHGIIGPTRGAEPREVLIKLDDVK